MNVHALSSFLSLFVLISVQTNAAVITQSFEFDDLGSYEVESLSAADRVQYFFEPFDASLGTLTDVSVVASATSQAGLAQFECAITSCTVEFPLDLVLTLEPGDRVVDEAGNFTTNRSGIHFGGVADIFFPSIADFAPFGWEVDDFYTTPLHYLAFYRWRCLDCSGMDDPLLVNVRGSATLTYEYIPFAVPAPSTPVLVLLGFFLLRGRYRRASPTTP